MGASENRASLFGGSLSRGFYLGVEKGISHYDLKQGMKPEGS